MTKVIKVSRQDENKLSLERCFKIYKDMLLIRRFEEKAGQLYGTGAIGGFCHLYIGQEAVIVGIQDVLDKDDATITSYRDHGHILAAGVDPKFVMAELTGRETGCSKGKGGSMHIFDLEKNFYGGHGIVGAQVSIGTGIAFGMKYKNSKNISVTFYGDGAANQGQVYESFNMASLWKLPVLYIVENNEYAMGTSVCRASSVESFYNKGEAFGIPGEKVNGMNVLEVREAAANALKYVRSGKGPLILEMKTYRYRGHSMSDPANYRSKEEVASMKENKDPINSFKQYIIDNFKTSEEKFKNIEKEIKELINKTAEFALNSPEPDEKELYTNIYVGE